MQLTVDLFFISYDKIGNFLYYLALLDNNLNDKKVMCWNYAVNQKISV